MAIPVSSFAFHLTYTCPLACAHCCFNSSPQVADRLDPAFVLEAIAHIPEDVTLVAFTGGEPFLHGRNLVRYVEAAKSRSFKTRIVTSGYFATSKRAARLRFQPLADAGLDELSISWDDYHEEFVAFDCVRTLVQTAREAGVYTAISSVQSVETLWTAERIRSALGDVGSEVEIISESGLNLTGRAETDLKDATFVSNGYLGPCPYVLTGPTMSAKNKLLACCGVIPDTKRLTIREAPDPEEIPELIEASLRNPLFTGLFLRGPYSLMEAIARKHDVTIPPRDKVGGNCEACKLLFETPTIEAHLDAYLKDMSITFLNEMLLLESLELLTPKHVMGLWGNSSATRTDLCRHEAGYAI
ncbi:radical SAM protein [Aurantimonas sp. C2-6-R+9]|uniref:radical SAM protein n=1 Tax=unclassified Aurantimonas TaxID=2638230 RepID=UPI002E19EC5A|nr:MULTISPECIES: radical SAM protein [unclassified Aurantimonas]MEC5289577.1 radical SAM protein [Aurantimonas sp. C2-3-R2]MEC5379542.1 radical SAM protein [Aurantimonas sp. C2-6-R+9]MEC5410658.1 radical SAM protein [Aurantimonas sp. C2-4-R8]